MGAETVTLWRPTGQQELDLVATSGWKAWPARLPDQPIFYPVLNRGYATKIARDWNVPRGGVGHVTRFEVRRSFLDRFEVQQVGGREILEYWIPAEDLPELNANIVGTIVEDADYRGPVADEEFTAAASVLGAELPAVWRDYLQGRSWFRRGWMPTGSYVWLYTPRETAEMDAVIRENGGGSLFPGLAVLGGDGARECLAVDLRKPGPIMLVDLTSEGWPDALPQGELADFIEAIDAATFDFSWPE